MVFLRLFFILFLLNTLIVVLSPAFATEEIAMNQAKTACQIKETSNINISFSGSGENLDKIKDMIEVKITELKALAKEKGATKFEIQNTNLNFNPVGDSINNTNYSYNSSYSFVVEPTSVAFAIVEVAQAKGWRMGMNMSSYRECP